AVQRSASNAVAIFLALAYRLPEGLAREAIVRGTGLQPELVVAPRMDDIQIARLEAFARILHDDSRRSPRSRNGTAAKLSIVGKPPHPRKRRGVAPARPCCVFARAHILAVSRRGSEQPDWLIRHISPAC